MKNCDQCEALVINGVFCHEIGCPNSHSKWDKESEEWVRMRTCGTCGYECEEDSPCCEMEDWYESMEDWAA